jgi:hypothetical protein
MGDKAKKVRTVAMMVVAAIAGTVLAGTLASAQGPGDYTTTTTATTTVTTGPTTTTTTTPGDGRLRLSLRATVGKQKIGSKVELRATCGSEACFVALRGKLRVAGKKGQGKKRAKKFGLKDATAVIAADETEAITMGIPRKARKAARKRLKKPGKGKVKANVRAFGVDRDSDTATVKRKVKLKKQLKKR